jgi:UDP-N-acetylmuramoyl-L-alanyl-D-glutamate--2,6-diaminopimelate ligase
MSSNGGTLSMQDVLEGVALRRPLPAEIASLPVTGLEYDSRRVHPGFLFFAFQGQRADGRVFARDAAGRGAPAVASDLPKPEDFDGPWIEVAHGRQALARAARNFYGAPDDRLQITGITGTNGKTTTTCLLDSVLRAAGRITTLTGTIQYHVAGEAVAAVNTTPESLDLYRIFAETRRKGGTHVTMEVSSHALALGRVFAIQFHTAVFTNLTRDHLDFHRTMEAYFTAKHLLFEGPGARPPRYAVINGDDAWSAQIRTGPGIERLTYGTGVGAQIRATRVSATSDGLRFDVRFGGRRFELASDLLGRFNVYNILAACGAGFTYGLSDETIASGIATCRAIPGRFERIDCGQPFMVVVDYAHTDDALRNVIQAARDLSPKRVITLFGCGGDRDRSKRPLMGEAAAEWSDFVVLTSDNPRSEDPVSIINDALVGLRRHDVTHVAEPDREKAIRTALSQALPGDFVILAGKGHEPYQVLADCTIPFDDREVARRILGELGYEARP